MKGFFGLPQNDKNIEIIAGEKTLMIEMILQFKI
jgi:hypothetical protein